MWDILLYKTSSGKSPIEEFILNLELKAQAKVYNSIRLLKNFGLHTRSPHIKKIIGTELWELRILGSDSIRIFYIAFKENTFLLLHGFKKKTMKIPSKEVETALERLADHRKRIK